MDCHSEGRNYVNPFEYDPNDVLSWFSAEFGGNETYPFTRRNLGLIPSSDYWIPYSYENGPFECLCDEENGFVFDEDLNDGSCFNCASIGNPDDELIGACAACHYEDGWVCDACQDDDYMVSPWGDSCILKIENCEIDFYAQPFDAFGDLTLNIDFDLNRWICQNCSNGFYFNEDVEEGIQPRCEPCKVENCDVCELHPDKCDICADELIPNYRGDECIPPIEFCDTEPFNYDHNGDVWVCPTCLQGYFPLDDTCQKCTLDPFCTSCRNN